VHSESMTRRAILATAALLALIVTPAWTQDENTPEGMAAIKPGEVAGLDRDSIRDFGPTRSFEASIVWGDTGAPRPEGHLRRNVRYVADCRAGTLLVAAVAVIDGSGARVKTMISPPGAADPMTPEAGSAQARWLQEVCRI
jgi:hypothetical protein